ncbi:alpha amylase C-terminal domain-containing protein, partial [Roseicyclus sp.]|uniref:alpha amylase C-terminal domain-containing protein n=1 Tax=Roseicyclus sp. TaxID=1914329 RepID=UPI003FA129D9
LLDDPMHEGARRLVRDLNAFYRAEPGLHARDCEPEGFQWIEGGDTDNNVFAFIRHGDEDERPVVVVSNMAPVLREGYRIGVPWGGGWQERLNTDAADYGGSGAGNGALHASDEGMHGQPHSLSLTLPPLATIFLVPG